MLKPNPYEEYGCANRFEYLLDLQTSLAWMTAPFLPLPKYSAKMKTLTVL